MSNHPRRSNRHHPVTKTVGATGTILTLGAALVVATPGTAGADTFVVNTTLDTNPVGAMSLREAIVAANGTGGAADLITFAPSLNGQTITLSGGEIEIDDDMTIQGPGADLLTVAGGGDPGDRIFKILNDAGDVTVSGLKLTGGNSTNGGGAIYSDTTGTVTLTGLHVTGNEASSDGGGVVIWGESEASVTVTGSVFDHNRSGGNGGGLHVYYTGGPVNITGNTFDQNYGDNYGGGLSLYYNQGTATVVDNTFTDNTAAKGGGIGVHKNPGPVNITGATISGATDVHYGGGISVYQTYDTGSTVVTITASSITNNDADEFGGGVRVKGDDAEVTIDHSTISGNYASVDGGGVYAYGSDLTITSSTISGNEAQRASGGLGFNEGEAGGSLEIAHSTITNNITGDDAGGVSVNGDATIDHTIIAAQQSGDDLVLDGEGAVTLSNSLLSDPDPGVVDGGNNEFSVADPGLGALASNGGPTQTHALLADSPALNSGDPAFAPPPNTDQRGEPRVAFVVIDKGAYEAQPAEEEPPAAEPVAETPRFTG